MTPTYELRFVKRELRADDAYQGRPYKYVLQQKWVEYKTDSDGLVCATDEEWRDVPLVEEG